MNHLIAILAVFMAACSSPSVSTTKANGNRVGHLRGFRAVDNDVKRRLLEGAGDLQWNVATLVDGDPFDAGDLGGVRLLLGGFGVASAHGEFKNGSPNAVNMLLWDLVLGQLAKGLSSSCAAATVDEVKLRGIDGNQAFQGRVTGEAFALFKAACLEASPETLQSLWLAVVGFEAPWDEVEAFVAYFSGPTSPVAGLQPEERLRVVLKALFLNPHFLLES